MSPVAFHWTVSFGISLSCKKVPPIFSYLGARVVRLNGRLNRHMKVRCPSPLRVQAIPCETSEPGESAIDSGVERLNGAWPRSALYVRSGPEFPSWLYASTTKGGLTGPMGLPAVPPSERIEPSFKRPHSGVKWRFSTLSNMWEAEKDEATEGRVPTYAADYQDPLEE